MDQDAYDRGKAMESRAAQVDHLEMAKRARFGEGAAIMRNRGPVDSSPTTAPQAPIQSALHEQAMDVVELHRILSVLEERLAPVLGPRPGGPDGLEKNRVEPTHIVERISLGNVAIRVAQGRIRELLDRLHL